MSEMIERVAYALAETDGIGPYEDMARAAIEAMLEPSNAMIVDGAAAVRDFHSEAGPYPRTKAMWRAMIDAALKEEK